MKIHVLLLTFFITITLDGLIISQACGQTLDTEHYARRRQQLMGKMDGGIAIFLGGKPINRNGDVDYEFRQNSDFYYLTGFAEPGAALVLLPGEAKPFIMFVRPRDPKKEKWDGLRHGIRGAMQIFGADTAFTIDQFPEHLPGLMHGRDNVYYDLNDEDFSRKLIAMMKTHPSDPPREVANPSDLIHDMRMIKDETEIRLMQRAIDITCEAQLAAMQNLRPDMYEYELEALIEYTFRKNGAQRNAFPSIVGAGPNATILHYATNISRIRNGDLVLIDVGAEYNYYAADVTRTIPASGRFSAAQREIYTIVHDALRAGIAVAAPGATRGDIEKKVLEVIGEGLFRLKLITDKNSRWQTRLWYPHGACHWLGMDAHDVGRYREANGASRVLRPGMVTTIEPGVYISEAHLKDLLSNGWGSIPEHEIIAFSMVVQTAVKKYDNIGIRIEDDILITNAGCVVLSEKAPKSIEAIEQRMQQRDGPE